MRKHKKIKKKHIVILSIAVIIILVSVLVYRRLTTYKRIDIQNAYSCVTVAQMFGDEEQIKLLKKQLSPLKFASYDYYRNPLKLMWYIGTCERLGIKYDKRVIDKHLESFYNKEHRLYSWGSYNGANETEQDMLSISYELYRELGDDLPHSEEIKRRIVEIYSEFEFEMPYEGIRKSFYNAGGDIIMVLSAFDIIDRVDLEKTRSWVEAWGEYFAQYPLDNPNSFLSYGGYYDVAKLYGDESAQEALHEYYIHMEPVVGEEEELRILCSAISSVNVRDNEALNKAILDLNMKRIKNKWIFQGEASR